MNGSKVKFVRIYETECGLLFDICIIFFHVEKDLKFLNQITRRKEIGHELTIVRLPPLCKFSQ